MNPKHTHLIAFCAKMEQKLDTHLFSGTDDEERKSILGTVAKTAAITGGGIYAGSAIKRGLAPMIADRRAGMRAMIPGFTQKSGLGQTVAATGTVLKDKPLAAIRAIGSTVAKDARKIGSSIMGAAKALPDVPVLARLRGMVAKFRKG